MSVESMYQEMKQKLEKVVPDVELRYKAELAEEINQLKKKRMPSSLDTTTWNRRCFIQYQITGVIFRPEP